MGARDQNFYNTIARRYGYVDEAAEIQDLYLSGRKEEAAAAVPRALLAGTNLVGPESYVAERIAAYREAGVTHLSVNPVGPDPVKTVETAPRACSTDAHPSVGRPTGVHPTLGCRSNTRMERPRPCRGATRGRGPRRRRGGRWRRRPTATSAR